MRYQSHYKHSWLSGQIRIQDHTYVVHQRKVYHNVPLWVLINTLTYGQISKLYTLLPSQIQSSISKNFPHVKEKTLEQYLKILTLFRNVCAHNERLYSFRTQIDFPGHQTSWQTWYSEKRNSVCLWKKRFVWCGYCFSLFITKRELSWF